MENADALNCREQEKVSGYLAGFFRESATGWAIGFLCAVIALLKFTLTSSTALVSEFLAFSAVLLGFSLGTFGVCVCFFVRILSVQAPLISLAGKMYFWGWTSSAFIFGFLLFVLWYEGRASLDITLIPTFFIFILSLGNYAGYSACGRESFVIVANRSNTMAAVFLLLVSLVFFAYILFAN